MNLRNFIRQTIRKSGFDIVRFEHTSHPEARRIRLMTSFGIDVVLDVGANTGQYAAHLRSLGFTGRIISFEPLRDEYTQLRSRASSDPLWDTQNFALGDVDGLQKINVAANSHSSSLLEVLPQHLTSAPQAQAIGKQSIQVKRLDSILDGLCSSNNNIYLKLDAQGYEMRILSGALNSLERIDTLQLEMSLTSLYEGETLLPHMVDWLYERDFVLVGLEPGHSNPDSGQLMQVDGIFHRFHTAGK